MTTPPAGVPQGEALASLAELILHSAVPDWEQVAFRREANSYDWQTALAAAQAVLASDLLRGARAEAGGVPVERIEKILGWLNKKTGQRCISCDHMASSHNELAYCQVGGSYGCSCETGTSIEGTLRNLVRDFARADHPAPDHRARAGLGEGE